MILAYMKMYQWSTSLISTPCMITYLFYLFAWEWSICSRQEMATWCWYKWGNNADKIVIHISWIAKCCSACWHDCGHLHTQCKMWINVVVSGIKRWMLTSWFVCSKFGVAVCNRSVAMRANAALSRTTCIIHGYSPSHPYQVQYIPHYLHYMSIVSRSTCCYMAVQRYLTLLQSWGRPSMFGSTFWDSDHSVVQEEKNPIHCLCLQQSNEEA